MTDGARVLTSARNPRIVELAKLHDGRRRRSAGMTLVEGPHLLADVLTHGADVHEVFHLEDDRGAAELATTAGVAATAVSQSVLRRLAGTEHPRGPVALVAIPEPSPLRAVDMVVLWDVSEPGNVGAIIRSAVAFGYAVATTRRTADVWAPKAVRAATAAQFGASIANVNGRDVAELRRSGLRTVATVSSGGMDPDALELASPLALLIGNEAHGLPGDVVAAADAHVTIPLEGGVESLNAAVAAGVVMFALRGR